MNKNRNFFDLPRRRIFSQQRKRTFWRLFGFQPRDDDPLIEMAYRQAIGLPPRQPPINADPRREQTFVMPAQFVGVVRRLWVSYLVGLIVLIITILVMTHFVCRARYPDAHCL